MGTQSSIRCGSGPWGRLVPPRACHERLDPLDPNPVAPGEADVDATLALELRPRAHEDDPRESPPAVETQVMRLGRLLPGARTRRADRGVNHVTGRVVGDVGEGVRSSPEAHGSPG